LRGELHARGVFAKHLDELVAENLDDLLSRREGGHDLLTDSFGADLIDKLLDNLEVDVGLEQRQADFAQGLVDVFLGQGGLSAEGFEGALEFFLKILEHIFGVSWTTNPT